MLIQKKKRAWRKAVSWLAVGEPGVRTKPTAKMKEQGPTATLGTGELDTQAGVEDKVALCGFQSASCLSAVQHV